jgi:hypothetical protein
MANPGISSSPTSLERLMTLQISASKLDARDKDSEDCERGGMSVRQIENA